MRRLFLSGLLSLLAFISAAHSQTIGTPRAVVTSNPATWLVAGVGTAGSLRTLGTLVDANPSANVTQLRNYDAGRDGTFSKNVISSIYTGTFDCTSHFIRNITIYTTAGLPELPGASSVAFFNQINAGTLQNCDMQGTVAQLSTSLDGQLQTYRVAGIAGFMVDAVADNVKANFALTINGYFNYDGILFADIRGTTAMSNLECQGSMYLSVTANANVAGCIPSFFQGSIDTMLVKNFTLFSETGRTPGHTQQCIPPPGGTCPTSGGYYGPAVGALGYSGSQCATATNVTVESTVSIQNVTNDGQGETGGITGPVFCGTLSYSNTAATVSGARNVGGVVSSLRYAIGSSSPSEVHHVTNTGNVTCTVTVCGGLTGANAGYLHHGWSTGTVTAPLAGNLANLIGYNYGGGVADHLFGWGTVTCLSTCGGSVGRNVDTTGTILDQAYTLSSIQGTNGIGGAVGNCGNLPGLTNIYWNTTTSDLVRGCGTNPSPGSSITGLTDAEMLGSIPAGFDGDWLQDSGQAGGYPYLAGMPIPAAPPPPNPRKYIVLDPSSTSPINIAQAAIDKYGVADFNCFNNTLEAWGSGGNGSASNTANSGGGGGGGAYARRTNFCPDTPTTPISFIVADSGSGVGTFTYFGSVTLLKAASGGNGGLASNGPAGSASNSAGALVRSGGAGGITGSGARSGGGGGGAGGPNGAGQNGGGGFGNNIVGGGGGGGGADGGTDGDNGTVSGGGNGGRSYDPTPPIVASFTASQAGTTLTISSLISGTIVSGAVVSGAGVVADTTILSAIDATHWLVSQSATIADEAMTSATLPGYTPGGAGSTSTGTPGAGGVNGSGAGGGSSSTSAASAGGAGSCSSTGSGIASGSGGGGGSGPGATLTIGSNGGAGGCAGSGGGGGGRGSVSGGLGGNGGAGRVVIGWTPAVTP